MAQFLRLSTTGVSPDFYDDLVVDLQGRKDEGVEVFGPVDQNRGAESAIIDIIVALGSSGAFTAIYQGISSFLSRNKDRSLTVEAGGKKVTISGQSLSDEKDLLQSLGMTEASA